jgi:glycosyltransferase A (GT-A) superfamily protein (DUF2064 family)
MSQFKKTFADWRIIRRKNEAGLCDSFDAGYKRVCIIGTDCPGLTTQIINESFVKLKSNDVVIGPATDGGYYLLGMENFWPALFENKAWSTDSVLSRTVQDAKQLNLLNFLLPTLTDVDEEKDLPTQY